MIIAVASCWKYRDAWNPFFALLDRFWPDHPEIHLTVEPEKEDVLSWCEALRAFTDCWKVPILLFQEDFFLNAPVETALIDHALNLMQQTDAGCVRLYPCPGGESDIGDPYFAEVPRGTAYRISCQAAIWSAPYLARVLSACGEGSPADFEVTGTLVSCSLHEPVLAFKRDVQPWPLQYLCSAINRGKWNPDAKRLCDRLGIEADWTMREFQPA